MRWRPPNAPSILYDRALVMRRSPGHGTEPERASEGFATHDEVRNRLVDAPLSMSSALDAARYALQTCPVRVSVDAKRENMSALQEAWASRSSLLRDPSSVRRVSLTRGRRPDHEALGLTIQRLHDGRLRRSRAGGWRRRQAASSEASEESSWACRHRRARTRHDDAVVGGKAEGACEPSTRQGRRLKGRRPCPSSQLPDYAPRLGA